MASTTKSNPLVTKTRQRKRLQLHFTNDGLTQQHFKDETDINKIMEKYAKTGLIDHVNSVKGAYGDFTSVQDYQLHLDQVIAADQAFMALPSAIRKRFDNSPAQLLAFLQDEDNRDEAVALGLVNAPPPPQPKADDSPRQEPSAEGDLSSAAKPPSGSEKPQA